MADTVNNTATPAALAVEAVKTETPIATPAPAAVDPRIEAMARKERQLHKMRKELETEKQSWKTKQGDYETNYIPKSRLAEDPLAALTEAGIDYNKLTEILLNNPNSNDPQIRTIRSEIKALRDAQEASNKRSEEQQNQQYQQALKQIGTEVKLLVDSDANFETIKETGMQEAVVTLIEQTFNESGVLMDIEEAATEIEAHLLAEALKLSKLKKLQPKTEPPVSAPVKVSPQQLQTSPRTLTNTVSTQSPVRSSEKERIARAFAAFKGELK